MTPPMPFERALPSSDCLSNLALDRLAAQPEDTEKQSGPHRHLAECEHCRARFAAVQTEKAAFAARPFALPTLTSAPRLHSLATVQRSTPRRRGLLLGGVGAGLLSAAAALVILMKPTTESQDERTKGTHASFDFDIVESDGTRVEEQSPRVAHPGDRLQWRFELKDARFVGVLSRDGAGQANIYFSRGQRATRLAPGDPVTMGVALDAVLGRETLYALFCAEPFDLEPLRARLQRSNTLEAPPRCKLQTRAFQKELP